MAGSGGRLGGAGPGAGEAVGLGAGLDDGGVEGEAVDDRGAEAGVGEGLGPAKLSLDAMATLAVSSRSVRTWNSSSAPAVEFHVAEAANLFFQLVSARYERASLIVTSNKPFAGARSSATK
jgi:hypothetical protein